MNLLNRRLSSMRGSGSLPLMVGGMIIIILFIAPFVAKEAGADDMVTRSFETEGAYTLGPGD